MSMLKVSRNQGIGIFVVLTITSIFLVINFLKGEDIFNSTNTFYTNIKDVEGLTVTAPVTLQGLKIGSVESIEFNDKNRDFLVMLKVKSKYQVPKGSIAEVYSADILGGRSIRIVLGNENEILESGAILESGVSLDLLSYLSKEIVPLREEIGEVLVGLKSTLDGVNSLLDSSTVGSLKSSIAQLNGTLTSFNKIGRDVATVTPNIKSILANVDSLTLALNGASGDIEKSMQNLNLITEKISAADLESTINSLQNLLEKIQEKDNSVGKLLNTPDMHNSVVSLIEKLEALVQSIQDNPKKYIKISVF